MPVNFVEGKMNAQQLANPFSTATVVVADEYVNTFPHPQGLITYLHRLCLQLDIDIVSLDRPVTVKGSWKTIIKIDAFLKTLISTLHNAISKGAVPSEEDFNTAFAHFEEDNNYRTESLESKHTAQTVLVANDLGQLKADDFLEVLKFDEDDADTTIIDKWYFNSNPRGKTVDKRKGTYSSSEKIPPEPYVIVEADGTSKTSHANLSEIEHALSQVYKKETIEKYHKKSCSSVKLSEQTVVSDGLDCVKESVDPESDSVEQTQVSEPLKPLISERKFNSSAENCTLDSLKYVGEIMIDNELQNLEPKSDSGNEEGINKTSANSTHDSLARSPKLRQTVRHKDSKKKEIAEYIERDATVNKRQREYRSSRKKRKKDRASTEKIPRVTNRKALKRDSNIKDKLQRSEWKTLRHDSKTDPQHNNKRTPKHDSKLENKMATETMHGNISGTKSKIKTKSNLTVCKPVERKKNKETRNNHKKESLDSQYYCDQCSYFTSKHLQLLEHSRRVHLTKKFRCEQCLKEFGFRKDLRRHVKCHTKAKNCCDICGKMYKEVRKLIEHKRIHDDDYVKPEFPCKFCTKKFSTKYVLAYHIKSDHLGMKRSYICPTCGKSFSQKNSYLQHANVHLGIKPFSCEICGKRFSYEKSLKEHKFMHKEDKVFSCTFCHKSFRQSSGLAIHLKVHKATKDYVCSMCGKGFSQKQSLVRHERIHGGEKPYECGICSRTFADSSVLRRHMILIHKRDAKQWRQDTLSHIPKRTDFFISVLNGDNSQLKDFETEKCSETYSQSLHQQNSCCQEIEKQTEHEHSQQQQQQSDTTSRSVTLVPGHFDNAIMVKNNSTLTNLRELVDVPANYTDASSTDVKPYVGCSSEKSDGIINSITTSVTHHVDSTMFPSSTLNIHSPTSLPMHSSISGSTCAITSPSHHYQATVTPHSMQPQPHPSSFVPVSYHQRQVNYDANNILPVDIPQVQYSTIMAQPYSQTIVLLQDSHGTITYHQPGVNVSFPGDSAASNLHLQQITPSMSSSPMPLLTDLSQAMTSGHSYDDVLSRSFQQPH